MAGTKALIACIAMLLASAKAARVTVDQLTVESLLQENLELKKQFEAASARKEHWHNKPFCCIEVNGVWKHTEQCYTEMGGCPKTCMGWNTATKVRDLLKAYPCEQREDHECSVAKQKETVCGSLADRSTACYAVKPDKKGEVPCNGRCVYKRSLGPSGGSCKCSNTKQRCKSVHKKKDPFLKRVIALRQELTMAVKVDPKTNQWSYLKMEATRGGEVPATWEDMGIASSLDVSNVQSTVTIVKDLAFQARRFNQTENYNKLKDLGYRLDNSCDPVVMASFVSLLQSMDCEKVQCID